MQWNIAPECVSTIILCIIWMYSRQSHSLPTLKNRLFQICFLVTFLAMTTNIASTICIFYYQYVPLILNWFITTVYFVATPLMGIVYFFYSVSIVYESEMKFPRRMAIFSIPAVIYLIIVIANPWTHWLFSLDLVLGYQRGPLIVTTYIVFYIYSTACFFLVVFERRRVDLMIRRILMIFPLMAMVVVMVQSLFDDIILSGSAATCALLIIYLYLQNKQISLDHLLEIPNRLEFSRMLKLQLTRYTNSNFVIIVLSLRDFKQINDTYGQQNGDLFLKAICTFLLETVRPYRLYRFSGDEFAIFIETKNSKAEAETIVAAISNRMEQTWQVQSYHSLIRSAIGIVSYPASGNNMEDLINGIEYAITTAKRGKPPNICYCTPKMLEEVRRKHKVIAIIEEAIKQDQLQVYYQPIWSVDQKQFTIAESLLRMPESPLGPLYPGELIPIAEETGLIVEMTYQILDKVCQFIKRLLERGAIFESITVNFSGIQFTQDGLGERVLTIIERNQVPYDKVKIEITESVMTDNQRELVRFMQQMHEKGVQIGLDDFGTGYCNLVSVMNMPLDVVKLDKSLLWSAMENKKSAIMMQNLTRVVQELGMRVVSEGVETEEQKAFVENCGCDWMQGFLYAKPMPPEEAAHCILAAQQ